MSDPQSIGGVIGWRLGEAQRLVSEGLAKPRVVPCRRCKQPVQMSAIEVAQALILQRACQRRGWKPLGQGELVACDPCARVERAQVAEDLASQELELQVAPSRGSSGGTGLPEVD